jgi:hypothetical protein
VKHALREARVLVASDNADDARQVRRQLKADFAQVQLSTDAKRWLQDFEQHAPEVLVLAFDGLDITWEYQALLEPHHRPWAGARSQQVASLQASRVLTGPARPARALRLLPPACPCPLRC